MKRDNLTVLSLFDGMSCGRITLDKMRITPKAYYANKLGISPAIIAGRYRKDTGNYRVFNRLIGSNQVRDMIFKIYGRYHKVMLAHYLVTDDPNKRGTS